MAAASVPLPSPWRMSEEEYLRTTFEPDADFVDGVIEERPMGEFDHSTWQEALQAWFRAHHAEWQLRARPELRCKVGPSRYRVPDVAVTPIGGPVEQIPVTPPVAVIEVLSPEDRLHRTVIKLGDYEGMGVRNVFLIDPEGPVFYRFKDGILSPARPVETLDGAPGLLDWDAIQAMFY